MTNPIGWKVPINAAFVYIMNAMFKLWLLIFFVQGLAFPKDQPILSVSPQTLDFGDSFAGETIYRKLKISNQGQGDLLLQKIKFNCGCALSRITLPSGVTKNPKEINLGTLKPNEIAEMEIQFNTIGLDGELIRKLLLFTNADKKKPHPVKLRVRVKKPFVLSPAFPDFGTLNKGQSAFLQVKIRSNGVGDYEIKKISNLPPHLSCESIKTKSGHTLKFHLHKEAPPGFLRQQVRLEIQNKRVNQFEFVITGNVKLPIEFQLTPGGSKDALNLGKIIRDQGAKAQILVINKDQSQPFSILDVRSLCKHSPYIHTSVVTLEKGMKHRVDLLIKPGIKGGFLQGEIIISTDHPQMLKKKFKFAGLIRDE